MSMLKALCAALICVCLSTTVVAQDPLAKAGTPVSPEELSAFFAVLPDGKGLPPGKGTAEEGKELYANKCAHCHGEHLEGIKELGGPTLVGGRGSLATDKPMKTVESFWPYTSTLYDYIWRAMPFDLPGSLTADEVYSLCAYILSTSRIIDEKEVMDAKTLPMVVMPNAKGFYDGSDPDVAENVLQHPHGSK